MPFAITKLSTEPIVITSWTLPFHRYGDNIRASNARVAHIAETTAGPVYRIINATGELSFSDIQLWLAEHTTNTPGSISDPRIQAIFVGNGPLVELLVKKARNRTGLNFPLYSALDEAIAYARNELAQNSTVPV